MAASKRRRRPSVETREAELARLTSEQRDDRRQDRRGVRRRAKHVEYEDALDATRAQPGSLRLQGDELRDYVVRLARQELKKAGCALPSGLRAKFERERSKNVVDRQAAKLQREIAAAIERAQALVREHKPRDGGLALAELAATVAALEAVQPPFPALTAMKHSVRALRAPFESGAVRRPRVAEPIIDVERSVTLRAELARLSGPKWTARTRALASLALGNWPPSVADDEPIDPREVLKIEARAMKTTRQRRVPD